MTAQASRRATARRRSFSEVLAGLTAIVALFVLLAGVPLALIAAFGLPVPHAMPSMSLLTHRLDLHAVIEVCSVVVWLAWLQLVWCVVAEAIAAVRNTGMPPRVPLAGATQALVHRLMTSALLLSTATALSPALMSAPVITVASAAPLPGPALGASAARYATIAGSGASGERGAILAGTREAGGPTATSVTEPTGTAAGITTDGAMARNAAGGVTLAGGPAPSVGAVLDYGPANGGPSAFSVGVAGTASVGTPRDAAELLAAAAVGPGATVSSGPAGHRTEKIYVVDPPHGRFHESLWEIAERHLGDGRRYHELFELNAGRTQPDGSKLTIASLIRPGWVLLMPHDAHGPGIKVITHGPHQHRQPGHSGGGGRGQPGTGQPGTGQHRTGQHGGGQHRGGQQSGSRGGGQHGNGHQSAQPTPAATGPAQGQPAPGQPTPGQSAQQPTPQPSAPDRAAPGVLGDQPTFPLELAGAGLLAAGVLTALAVRRRRQRRQRSPGRRLALPGPDAGWAEAALRLGADENAASLVDAGLRYLSQTLIGQGRTPPTVFAAHVGEENLDLWVAPPSTDAPHPWFAVGDGQVWRLSLASVLGLPLGGLSTAPAPYPGLVSIGTDATGRVLVDVAAAHGLIGVAGPDDMVRDALTAMAVELAASRWSEGIQLTLVGFGADLEALAPDRVRLVPTLAEALPDLESWAAEVAGVLGTRAPESALQARIEETRSADWEPHYLISAVEPSAGWERDRLLALAQTGQAAGGAYLAAGDVPGASWTWEITPDGRLLAGQLGLDVAAQVITHEQQVALAEMFEAADDLTGVPLSAPPPLDLAPAPHLAPQSELPVEVTLLGPVSVRAPGEIEPDRLAIASEIVVYLATHPGGVHPNVLTATIWPRGVTQEVRDAALDRVTDWLGTDGVGRPHLARDTAGRFRLGSGVRVDWQVFCTLVARAAEVAAQPAPAGSHAAATAAGGQAEAGLLEQALSLVTGPFLADRQGGRYAWVAVDGLEYEVEARVADAAHRLWQLRLAAGDPHAAMDAARTGLRAAPDELLWRDLITAAHATGQEQLLHSVVGDMCEWARVDDRMPGLVPETEALIDELLPSWRWSVA